jgi:hypothetical protein
MLSIWRSNNDGTVFCYIISMKVLAAAAGDEALRLYNPSSISRCRPGFPP